ncbi:MAG: AMP-binding protein [Bacteroidales bacterium]|jgi:long-chain acyl-CoA synthetase|nr:AMP-binding protein [Bacteroidales bacterium]
MTLKELFNHSCAKFATRTAVSFVNGSPLSYAEMKAEVDKTIVLLGRMGIQKGDKVAILSANMPNWGITYFSIASIGAIVVPILPDFHPEEVQSIMQHSESKAIFVSQKLQSNIADLQSDSLTHKIAIEDFSVLSGELLETPVNMEVEVKDSDIASIIYTSGTTGRSKGVVLTHKNITFDTEMCLHIQDVHENDVFLSILPLSHTYENTLGFILPIMQGASIYYLEKPPTASVLVPAMKKIRPTTMLSVPLVIEKIYRNQVLPKFTGKKWMKALYEHFTPFRKLMHRLAGKQLMKTFGGRLRFFGVGGAKLDSIVERFLYEARFPYAIGYGLTETAPLIAGANPSKVHQLAIGPAMHGVQIKIDQPDPVSGIGEVLAKGDNVMLGYYKDPELTKSVFTEDGWFRTGDLGCFDKKNRLYLKGRLKNMILGASGENIYPEDIESVINNVKGVSESLVLEQKGKLVAMVHLNSEDLEKQYQQMCADAINYFNECKDEWNKQLDVFLEDLKKYVNHRVNRFSQIHSVVVVPTPFEKTPTLKIKRYLYGQTQ